MKKLTTLVLALALPVRADSAGTGLDVTAAVSTPVAVALAAVDTAAARCAAAVASRRTCFIFCISAESLLSALAMAWAPFTKAIDPCTLRSTLSRLSWFTPSIDAAPDAMEMAPERPAKASDIALMEKLSSAKAFVAAVASEMASR